MKTITALFIILLSTLSIAQENVHNPDGDVLSIHITPYLTGGTETIKNFPSGGDYIDKETNITETVNYQLMVKYPLDSATTLSVFYNRRAYSIDYYGVSTFDAGFTVSFYFGNK